MINQFLVFKGQAILCYPSMHKQVTILCHFFVIFKILVSEQYLSSLLYESNHSIHALLLVSPMNDTPCVLHLMF